MNNKLENTETLLKKRVERGVKKPMSIRIHEKDINKIKKKYASIQAFIDASIEANFYDKETK